MENGRCRFHGGRTPKGRNWHSLTRPPDGPLVAEKLTRKFEDHERRRKAKAERLVEMTPEERERHAAWQRAHKPGPAVDRAMARHAREARKRIAAMGLEDDAGPAPDIFREGVFE